ncbi:MULTISPECIES: DUF1491 family protein [Ancylobacter]|uniref:DUF1491 family protein n=2 Tax=Ancylobacter TaxID=99 RepID=A0A839Z2D6_9HYPH|nr:MULTISPECIES: DUF1491 family protein [Ancylobacter]MBB3769779.1 hypothetical protein [Ancylobacter tetraedralis]MDQ0512747.1 hypothetical protein [Ancylobacter amanitiformis]
MRLKSGIWVSALIRRAHGVGAFAAVRRRGAEDAGAIFVKIATLDGKAGLFGPALPSLAEVAVPGERLFAPLVPPGSPESAAEERMAKEIRFDPDLWFVEIEDREGRHFLELARD